MVIKDPKGSKDSDSTEAPDADIGPILGKIDPEKWSEEMEKTEKVFSDLKKALIAKGYLTEKDMIIGSVKESPPKQYPPEQYPMYTMMGFDKMENSYEDSLYNGPQKPYHKQYLEEILYEINSSKPKPISPYYDSFKIDSYISYPEPFQKQPLTTVMQKPIPAQKKKAKAVAEKEDDETGDFEKWKKNQGKWSGFSAFKSDDVHKLNSLSKAIHDKEVARKKAEAEAAALAAAEAKIKAKEKFDRLSIIPPTPLERIAVEPVVDGYIFDFGTGGADKLNLLGAKGALLGEMVRLGLPVPEGFTISTEGKDKFLRKYSHVSENVIQAVKRMSQRSGLVFGDAEHPLLVSVRSGATVSMPGIMDTILNVGVNEEMSLKNPFLRKCYERLLVGFGKNVLNLPELINEECDYFKDAMARDLEGRIDKWKHLYSYHGYCLPEDPKIQLSLAIQAVFRSWSSNKAIIYRKTMGISDDAGTAVNVQRMVYGNTGPTSLTAAFFTRDPNTGKPGLSGSFIRNEQGDTLVGGGSAQPLSQLEPEMREKLQNFANTLEDRFNDMQEIEVTVECGVPYVLQTRNGKRTARAALKIITDLVEAEKISEKEALLRMKPSDIEFLSTKEACPDPVGNPLIGQGTSDSPGVICGSVVFSSDYAECYRKSGISPILVKRNLDTSDIGAIGLSDGILIASADQNTVSHALVVARGMNKAIVTGAPLRFDSGNVRMNSTKLKNGDKITLDANTGRVYSGHTKVTENKPGEELRMILNLADDLVSRGIIVSVPTPRDAKLVSTDYGVLFSPFGCLTPEQVDYLKGLIYGNNKGLNSFRRKLVRGYSEFIKSAGSDRVPLVLGVVSEENMDALTQNKVRLESRISLLERYARRLRVDDKKVLIGNVDVGLKGDRIVGAKIGDEAIYSNTRVKVDKICDDCGIRLKYSGGVFCLKRENLPSLKVIDPRAKKVEYVSPHARDIRMEIEVLESGLSRLSKADTHKVYEVQLEAAEEAVKSYRKRGINIADISFNQSSIRVDGKRYDLIPIKDLDRRRLERAQEVLNNGR